MASPTSLADIPEVECKGQEPDSVEKLAQNLEALTTESPNTLFDELEEGVAGAGEDGEYLRLKNEGNVLFRKDKFEEALAKYEEASKCTKNEEEVTAILHNQGATYEATRNFEKALELYDATVDIRPDYLNGLRRRCKLLSKLNRHDEAIRDLIEISVLCVKKKNRQDSFYTATFREVLTARTVHEAGRIIEARGEIIPPNYVIEGYLRTFYSDPASNIWRGTEKTDVDDLIAEGKADDLKGYLAAVRDLKLKKYNTIMSHCTDEINNPSSDDNLMKAYYFRGTFGSIYGNLHDCVPDLQKVIESPSSTNELKCCAHLKLALRNLVVNPLELSDVAAELDLAEQLDPKNPDIYFHSAIALIDRAEVSVAVEMLAKGIQLSGDKATVIMKTLYWCIKLAIIGDAKEQEEAFARLFELEPNFDCPECNEYYAQALMTCGQKRSAQIAEQMDKAVAWNPEDPSFKIKKMLSTCWACEDPLKCLESLYKYVEGEEENGLGSMYHHIGQLEMSTGNAEKGLAALDKAIELSNCAAEIQDRVGFKLETEFFMKMNDRLKAEGLDHLTQELGFSPFKTLA